MLLRRYWNLIFLSVLSSNADAQSFQPPKIFSCPPNILHAIPYDAISTIVTWTEPSSDSSLPPARSHEPGDTFDLGKTEVRYTFKNEFAEQANCDFTVEVKRIDTTPPEIELCPRGVSAPISPTESLVSVDWNEPFATDNSGSEVKMEKTHSPGGMFSRGFTVVNYTFTDMTGNFNSCSFTVTVYLVDEIPPTVENCPSDIIMSAMNHKIYEEVSWTEPSVSDETSQNDVLVVYKSHSPGDRFRAGVTNVLYVFADEFQNVANCTFQIHLDPTETPKVSSCPKSRVEIVQNDDQLPADGEEENPQFLTEGVSFPMTVTPSSRWNRTFEQRQVEGQKDIVCSYDVFIYRVDTIAPDISNCENRKEVMTASLGLGGWEGSFTVQEINFAASYNPNAVQSYTFPVGETVLAILLQDAAKNVRVCSVSVVVNPAIMRCPKRIRGESKTNENTLQVHWSSPTSIQGSSISVTPSSGSEFKLNSTIVQDEFFDRNTGRREICEFEVFVSEENPLVLSSCPNDTVVILPSDSDSVIVTWALPDADNKLGSEFNVIGISTTHNSGDNFSVGDATVVYVFESEDRKFRINCTFTVSVKDTTAPLLQGCPSAVRLSVLAWYGTFDWRKQIVPKDNSKQTEVFASHEANFQYPLGETPVNLTAVDSSGNEVVCAFPVIVSLILPLPVLILIAAVILSLIVFIISCCCCCRRRCTKKEENPLVSQGNQNGVPSNNEYDNQLKPEEKSSGEVSSAPTAEGNKYSEMEMDRMDSPKPSAPVDAGEYTYVAETAPPVPTTPRPQYVNDSVAAQNTIDRNPRLKKSSTVEPPQFLGEQDYLKPQHQYLYSDNIASPNEYSYAYDHNQGRHPQS